MTMRETVRRERRQKVEVDLRKLLAPQWGQLGLRFAFGAGIALAAGIVGLRWGPRVGGVFLAFPAILPAALTLMEKSEGTEETDIDAVGAVLGAVALLVFAVSITIWGGRLGVLAVVLAAALWMAAALLLFAAGRAILIAGTRNS